MKRRRKGLQPGWWISTALFLAVVAVAYLVWWLPAQRSTPPLDVRFVKDTR